MSTSTRETPLCRYHYDPLDRLADSTTLEQAAIHRHYCKARLATELQGTANLSILQHEDQLLAQQQRKNGKVAATLLAVDQQRSVLSARGANQQTPITYSPYGHRPAENGLLSLLGFNGERPDPVTGHYHLGNGYRQFNPMLMRFNSPDSWSPFGQGGINAYTYCGADPINRSDPTGHFAWRAALISPTLVIASVGAVSALVGLVNEDETLFMIGLGLTGIGMLGTAVVSRYMPRQPRPGLWFSNSSTSSRSPVGRGGGVTSFPAIGSGPPAYATFRHVEGIPMSTRNAGSRTSPSVARPSDDQMPPPSYSDSTRPPPYAEATQNMPPSVRYTEGPIPTTDASMIRTAH